MHPISKAPRWRRLLAWLGLAAIGLTGLCAFGVAGWKASECVGEIVLGRASLGWQAAPGRIGYAQLRERSGKGGKSYTPVIGYRYQAGGRTWTGYRIEATPGYSTVQAKHIMERFPVGKEVTVHHDGQGNAVLIQGVRANSWFGLGLWSLVLWFLAAMTWRAAGRHLRRQRVPGARLSR